MKCREILLNVDHMDSEAVMVNVLDFVYYMYLEKYMYYNNE